MRPVPRSTFDNLPDDKRARFVDEALVEFATQPFDQASITALTRRLGIAKGSVYQYFDDKVGLFSWLLAEAGRRKLEAIGGALDVPGDVFERLRQAYVAGLAFWRAEPLWAALSLQLDQPSKEPRLQALRSQARAGALAWLRGLLEQGIAEGSVRPDLDLDVAAHLVHAALSDGLLRAFLRRADLDVDDILVDPTSVSRVPARALLDVSDAALGLLRRALAP